MSWGLRCRRFGLIREMSKLELPFDQYQRYKTVEELVELIRDGCRLRVLDVGGHSGLISDFLPEDDTFVLDMLPFEGLNCVLGDGARLPFEDDSFDLVVSIDTLEHIPSDQRVRFLEEQLRVSRDYVLLAAPFEHENISLAEQIVNEFFIKKTGHPNDSLEEHFTNGLPVLVKRSLSLTTADLNIWRYPMVTCTTGL